MPKTLGIVIVACAFAVSLNRPALPQDTPPKLVAEWFSSKPPLRESARWERAVEDLTQEWIVYLDEGRACARLAPPHDSAGFPRVKPGRITPFDLTSATSSTGRRGDIVIEEVEDGWLIGVDAGEWGGALWWYSTDGSIRRRISGENVIAFLRTEYGLKAIVGVVHGNLDSGGILSLSRGKDSRWNASPFLDLEACTLAYFKESPKSILVVTTNRLLRVDLSTGKSALIADLSEWGEVPVNSVVRSTDGDIWIGRQHCVMRIRESDQLARVAWLTPQREEE